MSGLKTKTEDVAPDISVPEPQISSNQNTTSDSIEETETVVVIPDEQAIDTDIPVEAADQMTSSMRPRTQKRITDLVKKGHEKDNLIKEKEDRIKELESRMETVESKANEREVKEGRVRAEAALANLQKQRKEAYEDQDFDKLNELDLSISQASAQVNNASPVGFDSKKYFSENNEWYNKDQKKTKVAERINDEIWNDPKFTHFTPQQKLNEVARQTNNMFDENPHSNSSPTDGAPIHRPSKNTVYITESDYSYLEKAHPNKSRNELLQLGKKLKKRIQG